MYPPFRQIPWNLYSFVPPIVRSRVQNDKTCVKAGNALLYNKLGHFKSRVKPCRNYLDFQFIVVFSYALHLL